MEMFSDLLDEFGRQAFRSPPRDLLIRAHRAILAEFAAVYELRGFQELIAIDQYFQREGEYLREAIDHQQSIGTQETIGPPEDYEILDASGDLKPEAWKALAAIEYTENLAKLEILALRHEILRLVMDNIAIYGRVNISDERTIGLLDTKGDLPRYMPAGATKRALRDREIVSTIEQRWKSGQGEVLDDLFEELGITHGLSSLTVRNIWYRVRGTNTP